MANIDQERIAKINELIACSPELGEKLPDDLIPEIIVTGDIHFAMATIGLTIARKRSPLPQTELKAVFAQLECLLVDDDDLIANASAGLLRIIEDATRRSNFDLSSLAPALGPRAKAYLDDWSRV